MARKTKQRGDDGFLNGRLLIAMPSMTDPRFEKSVILLCHHTPETAMGIVINKAIDGMNLPDVLNQMKIEVPTRQAGPAMPVHFGGPVQTSRGFVLHSDDYMVREASLAVTAGIALTATVDVLKAIGSGAGPARALFALGYAGWDAGQLEAELAENVWLIGEPDDALIFGSDLDVKWSTALARIGVDPGMIADAAGHA